MRPLTRVRGTHSSGMSDRRMTAGHQGIKVTQLLSPGKLRDKSAVFCRFVAVSAEAKSVFLKTLKPN